MHLKKIPSSNSIIKYEYYNDVIQNDSIVKKKKKELSSYFNK